MKHLIMGTSGHVDHGKTSLVKALTGIDCDTHPEEKKRGLTINLGFAYMDIPSGDRIGIIDVPGHRDFIHTMVGGANGIDFAVLVIAADNGVMPQTREHLQIMKLLGIKNGLVALTKIDVAEKDFAEEVKKEITELVQGTFLEGKPVVGVSSVTGEGLDDLKQKIAEIALQTPERTSTGEFKLFIDRIFTVTGFGTVVTGSVLSGRLKTGDDVFLLPESGKKLRVRGLEKFGEKVDAVVAGDRASINLIGLDKSDYRRGMLLSDKMLSSVKMVDAEIFTFEGDFELGIWNQLTFHLGTYESESRVHLLDHDKMRGGGKAIAQIHLTAPCIANNGDRFILRNGANNFTVGGGKIIDVNPLHHRRRPKELVSKLSKIAEGSSNEIIAAEVRKRAKPVSQDELALALNMDSVQIKEISLKSLPTDIIVLSAHEKTVFMTIETCERLEKQILKNIAEFHKKNPLESRGCAINDLAGIFGGKSNSDDELILQSILENLEKKSQIKRVEKTWALVDHQAATDRKTTAAIAFVLSYLESCAMQTPVMNEFVDAAKTKGIDEKLLKQILRQLVDKKKIYSIENNYLHASIVDGCRKKLLSALEIKPNGMTVAEFRDLVGGNRKICLLLLARYDAESITRRVDDFRVITDYGRETLKKL